MTSYGGLNFYADDVANRGKMDLKSLIRPELWNEISNSYVAENYRVAILDAMRYLSKIIREKSGLDGDGIPLVGQAFGGDEPKLRLNKLQTQSEKDEQKGIQFIISGLYSAIRNPRTHEDIHDDKNTADPIIYFINYISNVIDIAKPPFTIEDFLPRVFDADFVESEFYTKELIKEVPKNKYLETLIEIYRRKSRGKDNALKFMFGEIIGHLTENEIKEFMSVVSAELDVISNNSTIITILRIIPHRYWTMVKMTAKMRIENKLIASIRTGEDHMHPAFNFQGTLGTWATHIIHEFTLKQELTDAIVSNLKINSYTHNRYILQYFLNYLPELVTNPNHLKSCATAMKRVIKYNDSEIKEKIYNFLWTCPDEWLSTILNELKDWTDSEHPESYLPDGSPFLGKVPYEELEIPTTEDEFPF